MLEQLSQAVEFTAFFTASKQGKTALTVTVDVWGPGHTELVTAAAATELGDGLYYYSLAGANTGTKGPYRAVFKTTDATVDQQWVPALWVIGTAGIQHLDADVSSRNAIAPLSAAATANAVWDEPDSNHTTAGTTGKLLAFLDAAISSRLAASSYTAPLSAAGTANAVWDELDSNHTIAGSMGKLLAHLDADISSRLAGTSYVTPDTGAQIAADVWNALTASYAVTGSFGKLLSQYIDAAISSRLATSGYTAPPTGPQIASDVWDEPIASHLTTGSTGKALSSAQAAGDPLSNQVPGTYASGTAGAALGKLGAAQITVTSPIAQSGAITIIRGDDYLAADGRSLDIVDASNKWPDLTGATVVLTVGDVLSKAGTIVTPSGVSKTVRFEPTATDTARIVPGSYTYDIEATLASGHKVTLVSGGVFSVTQDITP